MKVSTRIQEVRTETQICRRQDQRKALSHRPTKPEDPFLQLSFHRQHLGLTQPTQVAPRQVISRRHPIVAPPVILIQILDLQVNRPMICTTSKTNSPQLILQTTEILKALVTNSPKMQFLPGPLNRTVHHQTFHPRYLKVMNPRDQFTPTPSSLTPFPTIFHMPTHTTITISNMITQMTKKLIFQASMHTTHHHCTTDTITEHHSHIHTQILMAAREVCMRLVDILILILAIKVTAATAKMAIKSPTTVQTFRCCHVSSFCTVFAPKID